MHGYWIGGLIGAAVATLAMVVLFRTRFIRVAESPHDLETTIRTLVELLEGSEGWHTPGVRDVALPPGFRRFEPLGIAKPNRIRAGLRHRHNLRGAILGP